MCFGFKCVYVFGFSMELNCANHFVEIEALLSGKAISNIFIFS